MSSFPTASTSSSSFSMPPPPPPPSSSSSSSKPYGSLGHTKTGSASTSTSISYPSSWSKELPSTNPSRISLASHTRRPSRAERFEALVESARNLLIRVEEEEEEEGEGEGEQEQEQGKGVGLGFANKVLRAREVVREDEWKDAVQSLLKVVDGMSRQLSTHDELAAQLKIAQSNLTLAETHSEYLEEELRRRESRYSASSLTAAANSQGGSPFHRANTISHLSQDRPESSTSSSLFNGLVNSLPTTVVRGRKQTPSVGSNTSIQSGPPHNQSTHYRSSSSSPRIGGDSEGRISIDDPHHSTPLSTSNSTRLHPDAFNLQSQITSLESSVSTLRTTNLGLRKAHEALATKCADLEKTKEDLMGELESLSVELFQEANTMVASERKLRAAAEDEVGRLRIEIERLTIEIDDIKNGHGGERRPSSASGRTIGAASSSSLPPPPSLPRLPFPSHHDSRTKLSPLLTGSANTPTTTGMRSASDSPAESATSKSSKWFNFVRNSTTTPSASAASSKKSIKIGESDSEDNQSLALPSKTSAPGMARGLSSNSVLSISSVASSFFSADEHNTTTTTSAGTNPTAGPATSLTNSRPILPHQASSDIEQIVEQSSSTTSWPNRSIDSSSMGRKASLPLRSSDESSRPNRSPQISISSSSESAALIPTSASSPVTTSSTRSPRPSPLYDLAIRDRTGSGGLNKPVAIYSFEGESTAKSPRSPNEMRWKDAVKDINSPVLGSDPSSSTFTSIAGDSLPVNANPESRIAEYNLPQQQPIISKISQIPISVASPPRPEPTSSGPVKRSPGSLRLDTTARSNSPSPSSNRNTLQSSLPYRSLSPDLGSSKRSGPQSAGPAGGAGSISPTFPSRSLAAPSKPTFSRSNSSSSNSQLFTSSRGTGIPESSSISSLATSTSTNSHRTVDDLDTLMRDISDMQIWVNSQLGGPGTPGTNTNVGDESMNGGEDEVAASARAELGNAL